MIEYNAPDSKITLKITLSVFRWIEVFIFTIFIFFIFTFAMVSIVVHFSQQKVRFIDNQTENELQKSLNVNNNEKVILDKVVKKSISDNRLIGVEVETLLKNNIKIIKFVEEKLKEKQKKP